MNGEQWSLLVLVDGIDFLQGRKVIGNLRTLRKTQLPSTLVKAGQLAQRIPNDATVEMHDFKGNINQSSQA
jgi:hypothetical protein